MEIHGTARTRDRDTRETCTDSLADYGSLPTEILSVSRSGENKILSLLNYNKILATWKLFKREVSNKYGPY